MNDQTLPPHIAAQIEAHLTAERARLTRVWETLPRTLRTKLEEEANHGFCEPVVTRLNDFAALAEHLHREYVDSPANLARERELKDAHAAAWLSQGGLVSDLRRSPGPRSDARGRAPL